MGRLFIARSKDEDDSDSEDIDVIIHHHTHHVHHHHNPEGGEYAFAIDSKQSSPVVASVVERMVNHPDTWNAYSTSRVDLIHIVEMEYKELMQAMDKNSEEHVRKELTDLAAACVHALKSM